jgi:serine protease AprX
MKKRLLFLPFLFMVFGHNMYAQVPNGKYLIYFKDKANNTFSVSKPEEFLSKRALDRRAKQKIAIVANDLPPSKTYLDQIKGLGAQVWFTSRWLNAALVVCNETTFAKVKALNFVKNVEKDQPLNINGAGTISTKKQQKFALESLTADTTNYADASTQSYQLGIQNLHNAGFNGKGLLIAVLDDGFNAVDKHAYIDQKKILDTYDFVRNQKNVYDIGGHGNTVLGTMAPNKSGTFVGTAPLADYVLYRSEDAPTEQYIETVNYLFACEKADSIGADLINTSLGYNTFDFPAYDYTYKDMDGDKPMTTKAADFAASKGILVVVSAGNSGNTTWPWIGSPADADSILTVGAVGSTGVKVGFSSIGPTADGRIKPEVAAMGSGARTSVANTSGLVNINFASGTSYSSPILCGFAACLWQLNPGKTAMQMRQLVMDLGRQAKQPDNLLGFGVPLYGSKIEILGNEQPNNSSPIQIEVSESSKKLYINNWNKQLGAQAQVQVYTSNGLLISQTKLLVANQNSIDISFLQAGVYVCRVLHGPSIKTVKFFKY